MLVGFVAALRLARPYVPVEPATPPARLARMLAMAGPRDAVLAAAASPAHTRELERHGVRTVALDALGASLDDDPPGAPPVPPDPETPVYVLFTSGTTGDPKGVPIPHRALAHFADWLLATHGFAPGAETFLNQAPLGFDLSVMDVYGALLTGGTLFLIAREEIADPRRLFQRLDGAPPTVWVSTPSFARMCLAEPRFDTSMLPALRRFLFCGETLPPGVARECLARFPGAEVWNMYGPTETTVAVTAVRVTAAMAASDRPLPIGRPAPGLDVWIADPADPLRRLPDGATGEIVVAGAQVAPGYLPSGGADDARPAFWTLPDGRRAYRTGDLGAIDAADGSLVYGGRLDRQIKLHGYRLELEEIEARLRDVPGVADGAVLAIDRDGRPDHLLAVVVADATSGSPLPEAGRPLAARVRGALAEWLPDHALPRLVRRVAALPLTANGKLDRRALREMLG